MLGDMKVTITIKFGDDGMPRASAQIIDVPAAEVRPVHPSRVRPLQRLIAQELRRPWWYPTPLNVASALLGIGGVIWLWG